MLNGKRKIKMLEIEFKDEIYTLPKENIKLFAYTIMQIFGQKCYFETDNQAIEYLAKKGIGVNNAR